MKKYQSGFSLLEVMFATLIIAVGILAWVAAQSYNIQGRGGSMRMTTAVNLAQSENDQLANLARPSDADLNATAVYPTKTVVLDEIPFTVDSSLAGDSAGGRNNLVFDGKSVWMARTRVSWGFWGMHQVTMERAVLGK